MNTQICWNWSLFLAVVVLPLAGCLQRPSKPTGLTDGLQIETQPALIAATDSEETDPFQPTTDPQVSDAPVTVLSNEHSLPPNVRPDSPMAEAIKLATSNVEEGVILAFVTNSTGTFNLSSAEIIYLNDIGVSGAVINAMIQRDHMLQTTQTQTALAQAEPMPADQIPPPYNQSTVSPDLAVQEAVMQPDYSAPQPLGEGDYSEFYETLAPYGNWVDIAGYGQCWQPTVVVANPDWRPYCDRGRWVYTDCGWYWVSDYSWGWAPFHYGRWFRHERLGWCWAPDKVWAPAWVCWRYSNDHCGWAPLPPGASYVAGLGLTYRGRAVGIGFNFGVGADCFTFVSIRHFEDSHLAQHAMARGEVHRLYHQTAPVTRLTASNNHLVNHGVPPERVAAITHQPVHRAIVRQVTLVADNANVDKGGPGGSTPPHRESVRAWERRSVAPLAQGPAASPVEVVTAPTLPRPHSSVAPNRTTPTIAETSPNPTPAQSFPPNSVIVIGSRNSNRQRTANSSTVAHQQFPTGIDHHPSQSPNWQNTVQPSAPPESPRPVSHLDRSHRQDLPPQFEARLNPTPAPQPPAQIQQVMPAPHFQPPPEPPRASPPHVHVPELVHPAPAAHVESHPAPPPPASPPPAASSSHDHSSSSGKSR